MHETDPQSEQEIEARIAARTADLSALTAHLLNGGENERAQLARKLHDELGGLITAAKMDMSWLSARLASTLDAESNEKFSSVMQMLNQAMILNRRVVEDLRPSLLDHFGLAIALRSHFEDRCKAAGLECIATLPEEALEIGAEVQLALFRVAQEVLVGILARGGAKHVELVIEPQVDGYLMEVGDDGPGPAAKLTRAVLAMRYRIQGMGGRFDSESRPDQGNRVRAFVPRSSAVSA